VEDVREEDDIRHLDVSKQRTLGRGKAYKPRSGPTKTRWGVRNIPLHPSLLPALDEWLEHGWRRHVGRDPRPDDFPFPDENGEPFREERSTDFTADLKRADCPTTYKGTSSPTRRRAVRTPRRRFREPLSWSPVW
jgi:hypothetical protein